MHTFADAKSSGTMEQSTDDLREEKKTLNNQIAALQEQKNLLLKMSGMHTPQFPLVLVIRIRADMV